VNAPGAIRSVAVVGGGISGLAAAHRLLELDPSLEVTLYEAGPTLGGVLQTRREADYLLELAADTFITNVPWASGLCERVGLTDRMRSTNEAHRRAMVVRQGKLYPVPEGFMLMAPSQLWPVLTSPILSLPGKLRLLAEFLVPRRRAQGDESVASFASRRLGREAFERLVQPLLAGIYTADARKLSLAATLPRFIDMEQRHGGLIRGVLAGRRNESGTAKQESGARYSLFVAPEEGLGSLVEAIAQRLPAGAIRLNSPVESLRASAGGGWELVLPGGEIAKPQAVILATPAPVAANILSDASPSLSASLRTIPYAGSVVALAGFRREQIAHAMDGFGFVIPEIERRQILSVSFASQKFAGRAPAGHVLLRVFLGGSARPEMLGKSDDEIKTIVLAELAELLGLKGEPELWRVQRWPAAMPQYHLGHLDRVAEIERGAAQLPGIELAGNAYRGVGIPFCIRSGEQAAERIVASGQGIGARG
jgi:oxygen-dependent protoporphyrinogen oxidase